MNVGERLRLAIANPRFQVVMLVWAMALVTMLAFPFPQGFGIDLLFYRSALDAMLAGQSADMVVNPFATAASEWHLTPFFPPPIAALFGGSLMGLPGSIAAALAANVVVVGVAFVLMRRVTPPIPAVAWPGGRRARLTIALLGWFAFLPTIHGLWFGNVQRWPCWASPCSPWGRSGADPGRRASGSPSPPSSSSPRRSSRCRWPSVAAGANWPGR